ncbi:hypothetical protein HDV06_002241 [Boothiomyces sp. JEL0866]|nr:hypothetical protein HDV06_002241 [Boothiomyces sp. JEL0866]
MTNDSESSTTVLANGTNTAREQDEAAARKQMRRGIMQMVLMNIIFPLVIYAILEGKISLVLALALSGIPPALEGLYNVYKSKQMDAIAVMVIISIIFSIVVVLLTSDPKLILLKDSIQTVLLGLLFGTSVFMKENLIWRYNRQFSGHNPETQREMDEKWKNPRVKHVTNVLCIVWAVGFLIEAAIRIILIYTIPTDVLGYISPCLLVVVLGSLALFSVMYVKHIKAKYAAITNNQQ